MIAELDRRTVTAYPHAATATSRPRSRAHLQQWLRWLVDEGEVDRSPHVQDALRAVPVQPVDLLRVEQVRAVTDTCEPRHSTAARDAALVRVLFDTGARLAEVAGLTVERVDLELDVVTVVSKGRAYPRLPVG